MVLALRIAFLWMFLAGLPAGAQEAAAADLDRLRAALATVRFVAYTPREFRPWQGATVAPAQIDADLALIRPSFDGLITYSTEKGLAAVPELASARGFNALILGVWDPRDAKEIEKAIDLCRRFPTLIVGLALGNEGVVSERYGWPDVAEALNRVLRELPHLPLTTSEPFGILLASPPPLLERLDFLLPNIHPLSEPWFATSPEGAASQMVVDVANRLRQFGKPILIKETGLPSGPPSAGLTPERQIRFWRTFFTDLRTGPDFAAAAFEAFDAPWKPAEIAQHFDTVMAGEAHWGFFTADGQPKPVLRAWLEAVARTGKSR
jgi:exo-beta-1,3-glucanase (GH17 family)